MREAQSIGCVGSRLARGGGAGPHLGGRDWLMTEAIVLRMVPPRLPPEYVPRTQLERISIVELLNMAAGGLEQLGQFGCLHISRNGALERQVGAKRLAGAWMGSRRGIIAVVVPAATV